MSDVPFIDTTKEAAESAKNRVRSALSWLSDPHPCSDCGASCEATVEFVESQAMAMNIWKCPDCDSRFYREESDGFSTDPYR